MRFILTAMLTILPYTHTQLQEGQAISELSSKLQVPNAYSAFIYEINHYQRAKNIQRNSCFTITIDY